MEMKRSLAMFLLCSFPLMEGCEKEPMVYESPADWEEYYAVAGLATSFANNEALDALLGEPDLTDCSDPEQAGTVWRAEQADIGIVTITLDFPEAIHARRVTVYEGKNPGSVHTIMVSHGGSEEERVVVFSSSQGDPTTDCPGKLEVEFDELDFTVDVLFLKIDTDRFAGEFEEIDTATIWDYQPREN